MTKNKKKRQNRLIISLVLLATTIIFSVLLILLNILPMVYNLLIIMAVVLSSLFTIKLNFCKKGIIGVLLSILIIIILSIGNMYLAVTIIFFNGMNRERVDYRYQVLVLKNSKYTSNKELRGKKVYLYGDDKSLIEKIEKKYKLTVLLDSDFDFLLDKLNNKEIDALLIESSFVDMLVEEDANYFNNYNMIDYVKITKVIKKNKNDLDVTKESFNILITGIDTTGKVTGVARSDVNILVTVNPKTNDILLTSIPRDYYVEIKKGKTKDKITHSGIYGVDTTMYAVSNLLDVDIDYYIKVNFTSVVNIVDTLGGVEVYSDTNFTSGVYEYNEKPFTFKEGKNKVNGKQALAFARERKSFYDGDRRRNIHQQELIKGIVNKVLDPQIIIKYNGLLNALSDSFVTNMNMDDVKKLIKKQIKNNKKWTITNSYLTGKDGYETTYSYKSKLYVMIPDADSVKEATLLIKQIENK